MDSWSVVKFKGYLVQKYVYIITGHSSLSRFMKRVFLLKNRLHL